MPIINLQRRLSETGRIRIGQQVPSANGKRPAKIEKFRLTSSNEAALRQVAKKYGGEVKAWGDAPTNGQWELFTESSTLDVVVPPEAMSYSVYYELWSAGGCQRRCNGAYQIPGEEDCVCDPENRECKPHTRLSIMLADVPGSGLWRLDTQGWNAANEIGGAFELAKLIAQATGRSIVPGRLRLEQREVKRPNPNDASKTITRKFAVPVLDFDVDMSALAKGSQEAISSGPITPVHYDDEETLSTAEQLERINTTVQKPKRSNAAEPVRPTGIAPRARGVVREDDDSEPRRFGDDDDPRAVASKELFDKLKTAFGMLDDADKSYVTGQFADLEYSTRMDAWNSDQVDTALDIIDGVLKSKVQVEGETVHGLVKPDEIKAPRATKNKITQLSIRFEECGFGDREIILDYCSKVAKRTITTRNDLTTAEANLVLAQLSSDAEQ